MYTFVLIMLLFSIVLSQIYLVHVFSLWETQNYRIHIYMIEKNNEIIMDYSRLDMINSEICNGILNCNTRSYVIPVY